MNETDRVRLREGRGSESGRMWSRRRVRARGRWNRWGGYDSHAPCPSWLRGERKMSETKTRNAPLDSLRTPGGKQAIRDEEKEERKTKQKAI